MNSAQVKLWPFCCAVVFLLSNLISNWFSNGNRPFSFFADKIWNRKWTFSFSRNGKISVGTSKRFRINSKKLETQNFWKFKTYETIDYYLSISLNDSQQNDYNKTFEHYTELTVSFVVDRIVFDFNRQSIVFRDRSFLSKLERTEMDRVEWNGIPNTRPLFVLWPSNQLKTDNE